MSPGRPSGSWLSPLDSLLRLDHGAAHVVPTVGADDVRHHHRATLGTSVQLLGLQGVVRTPLARTRIGVLTLGESHGTNLPEGGRSAVENSSK